MSLGGDSGSAKSSSSSAAAAAAAAAADPEAEADEVLVSGSLLELVEALVPASAYGMFPILPCPPSSSSVLNLFALVLGDPFPVRDPPLVPFPAHHPPRIPSPIQLCWSLTQGVVVCSQRRAR
jgi:hypothetical protein